MNKMRGSGAKKGCQVETRKENEKEFLTRATTPKVVLLLGRLLGGRGIEGRSLLRQKGNSESDVIPEETKLKSGD